MLANSRRKSTTSSTKTSVYLIGGLRPGCETIDYPRFAGNPYQYRVKSQRELEDFIAYNNGKNPCFWSHNGHPTKDTIIVRTIPFDFDDKEHLERPHADMQSLASLCEKHGVDTLCVDTTNKGFHVYLCFKPVLAQNNGALKDYYRAVQLWAVEQADLKTWDKQLFGDTRRMMRIPGTIHQKTGRWCRKIDPSWSLEHIQSLTTPAIVTDFPEGRETLPEFCRRLGIKREAGRRMSFTVGSFTSYDDKKGNFDEYVRQVLPRMCTHNALMTTNPHHFARLDAIIALVRNGYDIKFIVDFIRRVSEHYFWEHADPSVQGYFIEYQVRHPGYSPYSCEKLREAGLCVGKQCPIFERAFPGEA